ncbi:hypothetical protein [Listeria fleischmannii]|uniref:Uncharacterized protein n=1 Tax=Listeria fleischmannii FSL S10-1203 TaxID=1265822 RepID=W7DXV1_9LIST|nr:hypothetical protein [Listeria fleischmannii]EUJ53504.1 hypothetical protein MCOL2_10910 [Listeria fleischmannii FSL S10-1203]
MKNYTEIEITIQKLLPLLEKYNDGRINYQIKELKFLKELLRSDAKENEKNSELRQASKSLFPPQGGLTDFYVWKEDGSERIALNKPIDELTNLLWNLIRDE